MTTIPRERLLQAELLRNLAAGLQARGFDIGFTEKQVQPGNLPQGTLVTVVELHVTDEFGKFDWHAQLDVREQQNRISDWRSKPNGKYYASVGQYGDRKTFVLGAKGWNMDGILDTMEWALRGKLSQRRKDILQARNQGALEAVRAAGVKSYGDVAATASSNAEAPILLTVSFKRNLTAEQALKLVAALKELGVE